MLIDLLADEYKRLHPDRNKPDTQFGDEIIALCSLLDRRLTPAEDPRP